jgi:hypothetical protein
VPHAFRPRAAGRSQAEPNRPDKRRPPPHRHIHQTAPPRPPA